MTTGSYGSSSIVGVGRRPLLQKIATVTVAISLTIATADTFSVAESQYYKGFMDSTQLVDRVVESLEIRIIQVISDTFLWLAQVQTLIRLFPRHKEKVTIKWLGFAMVSFDTIFSILDSFVSGNPRTRPRSFSDAIPALNYLFELAISLIYASCVVYYCLSKRRFAFWHPKMKNICLVALLSLVSVLIPVVFFVLDISQPNLAGWGEYIRWVGAAAASVVVWEWVERIESLERDERKDGILGREIFDGDEMLNMTPSEDANWHVQDRNNGQTANTRKTANEGVVSQYRRLRVRLPLRKRRKAAPPDGISTGADATNTPSQRVPPNLQLATPGQLMTPPSRSDTGSAASTVYAIRYHNLTTPSPNPQQEAHVQSVPPAQSEQEAAAEVARVSSEPSSAESSPSTHKKGDIELNSRLADPTLPSFGRQMWQAVPNPFKRRRAEPPAEVADAQNASGVRRSPIDRNLNLRARLGAFAAAQKDRFASRGPISTDTLPVTVIPAPKSNERTWSPGDMRDEPEPDGSIAMGSGANTNGRNDPGAAETELHDLGQVLIIPAPSHGRTWSPDDAYSPAPQTISTPERRVQPPDATITRPSTVESSNSSPQNVYTARRPLTIPEIVPPTNRILDSGGVLPMPISPRSGYAPPPAIAPIAEHAADETESEIQASRDSQGNAQGRGGGSSEGNAAPHGLESGQEGQTGGEVASTSIPNRSPTATTRGKSPSKLLPQNQNDPPSPTALVSKNTAAAGEEDGRNTGGTGTGTGTA